MRKALNTLPGGSRMIFAFLLALAFFAAPVFSQSAFAADHLYNLPLDDCDIGTYKKCVITAYYDLNKGSGSLKDWNCGTKTYSGHKGTDIGVAGTINVRPVVAAADGTVAYTNDGCYDANYSTGSTCGGGYGNYVKISHADTGHSTYYAHMANGSIVVKKGDKVKCGQLLGKAASSGNSTGPHLHFEVRYNSDSVRDDPYTGSCGGPLTYWKKQNGYKELPANDQCAPVERDDAAFQSETVPDDSVFTAGEAFTKTWTIKNTGNTTWTAAGGYRFVSIGGTQMSSVTAVEFSSGESIAPGAAKTWSVAMRAPATPGTYTHNWSMSHNGTNFGGAIFTRIVVVKPAAVDNAALQSENFPGASTMPGGEAFTKVWSVKNTGNTTWTKNEGYRFVHTGGELFGASSPLTLSDGESVAPGAVKTWTAEMRAPEAASSEKTYRSTWQMEKGGAAFGDVFSAAVTVPAAPPVNDQDAGGSVVTEDAGDEPPVPTDAQWEESDSGPAFEENDAGNGTAGDEAADSWQELIDPQTGFVTMESGCSAVGSAVGGDGGNESGILNILWMALMMAGLAGVRRRGRN